MLFRKLYNWIKYKTLPPSTLHKQRLFVERDTKHKRVTSNFGLNFRNSKWSKYESYNIKPQHLIIYIKIIKNLLLLLIIFLLVWWYNKYIIIYYIFNNALFIYWTCLDALDHCFFSFVWFLSVIFYKLVGMYYYYFFYSNFSLRRENAKLAKASISSKSPSKNVFISKHELNWTLYSWITVENSHKNSEICKSLFDISINNKKWNELYFFFTKFFKMSYFLNNINYEWIFFKKNVEKNVGKNFFVNNIDNLVFTNVSTNTFIKNNAIKIFNELNINDFSKKLKNDWNFFNFNNEFTKYPFLIKNKTGLFFFNNLNYQKFNNFIYNFKELSNIDTLIKNQLILSKWNRWLYRYSILHRKVFKNSHKLTLTKRLINFGFWDSEMFNKNLWISEHYNKYFDNNSFSSLFSLYYNNFFKNNSNNLYFNTKILNNFNNQIVNLNNLNYYENSFFFFLKRFYFFNSLSSNLIKTTNLFKNNFSNIFENNSNFKNNSFLTYSIFLSFLPQSLFLNLNFIFLNNFKLIFFKKNTNVINSNNLFYSKDLYLLINENDFLSKENLNTLLWTTSNLIENNNLIFFNYLTIKSNFFFSKNDFFFKNNYNLNNFNYYFSRSLINNDNFYLNDLLFLISNYNK